jgi:hypothetical protein
MKFSHYEITLNVVYITSMLYVFGFTVMTIVENL